MKVFTYKLNNLFFKIEVELIYSVVLVSSVQQSDCYMYSFSDSFPL